MDKVKTLKLEHITKVFGSVKAINNVSLEINAGEILSILGENGSGKTSLMNVIAGIYAPESGEVFVNGNHVSIKSPRDAFKYRIGMVHQHFKLVNVFSAVQNVVLGLSKEDYKQFRKDAYETEMAKFEKIKAEGREPTPEEKANFKRKMRSTRGYNLKESALRIERICNKYGFHVDPYKPVYEMSVSEKQTLEIVKILYRGADVLILDEPTAVLTPQETQVLFNVLRNMRDDGKAIIIITHKLNEVMEISDKVAVFRKGEHINTVKTSETNPQELTDMMVGKKTELNIQRDDPVNPDVRLEVTGLNYTKEGKKVLNDINFIARGGEILGIAGIAGSGQKELLESIAGLVRPQSGEMIFNNPKENKPVTFFHKDLKQIKELAKEGKFHYQDGTRVDLTGFKDKEITDMVNQERILFYENEVMSLRNKTPLEIRNLGIKLSFVPEDRLGMGLVGEMDIIDNMALRSYRKGPGIFVHKSKPASLADEIVEELEVVTPNTKTPVGRLSGGNIQKVLVGREISSSPKILMTAYPVRGLDINSSYLIYNLLNTQKKRGTAVIYVGEDLDVLLALCDRIMVICDGRITGTVNAKEVTKEQIGILMTGGSIDD
ncbi:MAG: ABC transporter ATP-binding protein [Bacilli bacterium]|nr:ABC transporter ATP-binding protein [Bacilli bacterium]